jgi:divinyl protochlorophyllide a 8-vinyl-reductase
MTASTQTVGEFAAGVSAATAPAPAARIGPNAIIQIGRALEQAHGRGVAADVFRAAGLDAYLAAPPAAMVDECQVIALHASLRRALAAGPAGDVAHCAGFATGDYLLAHRIPRLAQRLLRLLPVKIASRLLLAAIARNAWTFVGSGTLATRTESRPVLVVEDCPICRGVRAPAASCAYYRATFERLFRTLVDRRATVRETRCIAAGDPHCRFDVEWP